MSRGQRESGRHTGFIDNAIGIIQCVDLVSDGHVTKHATIAGLANQELFSDPRVFKESLPINCHPLSL